MRSLLPRSLTGQIALVMTLALLVASAVNFALLWTERSRAGLIEQTGPSIARFVDLTVSLIDNPPATDNDARPRPLQFGIRQGGGRFMVSEVNLVDLRRVPRNQRLEQRLKHALEEADAKVTEVRAARRNILRPERNRLIANPGARGGAGGPGGPGFGQGPGPGFDAGGPPQGGLPPGLPDGPGDNERRFDGPNARGAFRVELAAADGPPRPVRELILAAKLPDGRWLNSSILTPEIPQDDFIRLAASTVILFGCVLGAALWVSSRLGKPLQDLAHAASRVGANSEPEEVVVRGPADVRQTLEAFNAMSQRVSQLLGEKDVMLGALGHDLRTPLASLRIRLETMEPETERAKAVKTIEETARLLEDILELARQGRSSEPVQTMDASVLLEDLAEDYAETGAPVTIAAKQRAPISVRPVLFRRMMRNLIDNAVAYGKTASLTVSVDNGAAVIRVEDEGPGMSEAALATASRPFIRGDDSRNRRTGGSGLGLALADAIAKAHRGDLKLENRKPTGLAAIVSIPLAKL